MSPIKSYGNRLASKVSTAAESNLVWLNAEGSVVWPARPTGGSPSATTLDNFDRSYSTWYLLAAALSQRSNQCIRKVRQGKDQCIPGLQRLADRMDAAAKSLNAAKRKIFGEMTG